MLTPQGRARKHPTFSVPTPISLAKRARDRRLCPYYSECPRREMEADHDLSEDKLI